MAIGFDKHPRGAFNPSRPTYGIGDWYGETGLMLTTQFFAHEDPALHARARHHPGTLAKVAAKAFRNGALNPNAWRREPLSEEEIAQSPMISRPADAVHVLLAGRGRRRPRAVPRRPGAAEFTDAPVFLRSAVLRSRRFGSFEVFSPWLPLERGHSPTVDAAAGARSRWPASGRARSTSSRSRTPSPAPR